MNQVSEQETLLYKIAFDNGMSIAKISEQFKRSPVTISKAMQRMGLRKIKPKPRDGITTAFDKLGCGQLDGQIEDCLKNNEIMRAYDKNRAQVIALKEWLEAVA